MERVATFLWPLLGLTCVLLQLHAVQGRWMGSVQGQLPPCGPGGVPGFDCFDPPNHPLPPCDFKHQRPGFDCWPPASRVGAASPAAFRSKGDAHQEGAVHVQRELPPCGPGGVPGFDCYDPPNHPLPPCDFNHQRIGFDCSGWPPASHVDATSPATFKSKSKAYPEGTGHVQQELPPCGPGGVPGFDCYDPPDHPLPPCDFNHQRIGFDCSGWPPAGSDSLDDHV